MTNEITLAKQEFALDLTSAGLTVQLVDYVPDRITPPVVLLKSASPYLTPASIGNEYILHFDVVCVAQTATNAVASEKLDAIVADVINALPGYAEMVSVAQPYSLLTGTAEYLAADISVNISITI
jgi:hypothetical protein